MSSRNTEGPVGAGFDAASVPPYPVVRLAMRGVEGEESFEGLVDGEVVVEDDDLERVRAAVIRAAADRAIARPGMRPAIRAVGEDIEGDSFDFVVTGDGEVFDRPVGGATKRAGTSSSKRGVVAGAVLLSALLLAGVGTATAIVVTRGDDKPAGTPVKAEPAPPSPTPTQVPVEGAPGYAQQAAWSVPVGEGKSSTTAQVATDGRIVVAPADGSKPAVAAYDVHTGQRRWRASVDQQVTTGPAMTQLEGRQAVVAASSSKLYAWTLAGDLIGSWKLASGQKVMTSPTGVVVAAQGSQHPQIIVGGKLTSRVLPAASTAVSPAPGGILVAAGGSGQVWSVGSSDVAGSATNLEAPGKTTFKGVVASSPSELVAAFTPKEKSSGKVVLRSYELGSWKPKWTTGQVSDSTDPAMVSPDGSWATYGSTVLDMASGETKGLPQDWRTTSVNNGVGFGITDAHVRAVTKAGLGAEAPSSATENAGSQPRPAQAAAGSFAFLVASDGDGMHLYAIPLTSPASTSPAPSSSSSSSSSAKKSPSSAPKGK